MKIVSLAELEVVKMITCGATCDRALIAMTTKGVVSDDNFVKIMFLFQRSHQVDVGTRFTTLFVTKKWS